VTTNVNDTVVAAGDMILAPEEISGRQSITKRFCSELQRVAEPHAARFQGIFRRALQFDLLCNAVDDRISDQLSK
jgi:hypothetical protein